MIPREALFQESTSLFGSMNSARCFGATTQGSLAMVMHGVGGGELRHRPPSSSRQTCAAPHSSSSTSSQYRARRQVRWTITRHSCRPARLASSSGFTLCSACWPLLFSRNIPPAIPTENIMMAIIKPMARPFSLSPSLLIPTTVLFLPSRGHACQAHVQREVRRRLSTRGRDGAAS